MFNEDFELQYFSLKNLLISRSSELTNNIFEIHLKGGCAPLIIIDTNLHKNFVTYFTHSRIEVE